MKSLVQIYEKYSLVENGISDKGTSHSYIEEYERLLAPLRARQPLNVLEIGLCRGGSLRMWHEYFENSHIYGVDITDSPDDFPDLKALIAEQLPRMEIHILDARKEVHVDFAFGEKCFDVIIEDASHKLQDSIAIYNNFIKRLNLGGLYFIEDVENLEQWRSELLKLLENRDFDVLDLRTKKGRYDDVLIAIR